jgi:hypothetical protein
MPNDPAREWVERVLGVRFSAQPRPANAGKTLDRWRDAHAEVVDHLAAFKAALLADETIKVDPRISFVTAAAAEIPRMLPASSRALEALLKSGDAGQSPPDKALSAVAAYRQELDAAAGLARLEAFASHNLKFPLAVRKMMAAALDDIETSLHAAE